METHRGKEGRPMGYKVRGQRSKPDRIGGDRQVNAGQTAAKCIDSAQTDQGAGVPIFK